MLEINHLTIQHRKDLRKILNDFSIAVRPDDKIAVIGEEGNGKSTLLKCIYDTELISDYCEISGSVRIRNEKMGYLPQEMEGNTAKKAVYEYFHFIDEFGLLSPAELYEIARKIHIDTDMFYSDQKLSTLSGGEKVKVQLAGLMIRKPTLLLLDEPSNDLDIKTLEWLEQFIRCAEIPIIFISHDETLLSVAANRIVHIELLKRKNEAKHTIANHHYCEYMQLREQSFANQLMQANNQRRQDSIRMEKFRHVHDRVQHDLRTVSRQAPGVAAGLKRKMKSLKSAEKRYMTNRENMTAIPIREEAIFFRFYAKELPRDKKILDFHLEYLQSEDHLKVLSSDISLHVEGSKKICIIGENGCGKTTLLRKIYQHLMKRTDIVVGYMPQEYAETMPSDCSPVSYLQNTGDKDELTMIRQYLGAMNFTVDEMEHAIHELSGGQKAKILMLRMHLMHANVLLLDEPTRNFSPLSAPVIRHELAEFSGAIIAISHDRRLIREVFDEVYVLRKSGLYRMDGSCL